MLQTCTMGRATVTKILKRHGLVGRPIGEVVEADEIRISCGDRVLFSESRSALHRLWSETTWQMQTLRDNPESAQQEYDRILDIEDPGLAPALTFDPTEDVAAPFISSGARPRMAILREQGVNGQVEMAAAFDRAGFESIDVHMSDVIAGRISLADFKGFVAPGGFSYGDTLGGGEGWAKSILFNPRARDEFSAFFARKDSFALGVCNGCQMMAALHELIPGRRGLAALREEPLRAVRGPPGDGGGHREPLALLRGHGRQPHPGGHRPRGGARAVHPRPAPRGRDRRHALRGQPGRGDRDVSPTTRTAPRWGSPGPPPPTAASRS